MVREILQLTTTLKGRGEKRMAIESLLKFLEKNPGIRCDSLFQKLMELHDNDRNHPNVEKYKEFVTDRLERKAALASELDEWSKNPLDIEKGVQIVKSLVKEDATADDLRKATKIAVDILKEKHHEQQSTLEANQKAHQLIQAMGSVVKKDAYLSYHFAKCKFALFLSNTRARKTNERCQFSCYLAEAEDCATDAVQLTRKENNLHLANGYRLLGYIHSRLLRLKKSTVGKIEEFYDNARWYNPKIHINVTFIPPESRSRYKIPE